MQLVFEEAVCPDLRIGNDSNHFFCTLNGREVEVPGMEDWQVECQDDARSLVEITLGYLTEETETDLYLDLLTPAHINSLVAQFPSDVH